MKKPHTKARGILFAAAGMFLIPGSVSEVSAAERKDEQPFIQASGIESVLEKCYETEVKDNINLYLVPTEATEMFHILKNAENPHFYGFRLHTFRTTDKVVRYGINNQFDFAEHPAVIQRGEKRTINICVAVPDVA